MQGESLALEASSKGAATPMEAVGMEAEVATAVQKEVARGCQEAAEGIHESRGQQEAAGDSQG